MNGMMSIEQAIKHAEEVEIEQIRLMLRYDAASGYMRSGNESIRTESAKECEKCAAEHRQLATWLRELHERRKAPEIVRCGECRHRDPEDKKCDCGHDIIWQLPRDDDWFCADAERRTDGENLPE